MKFAALTFVVLVFALFGSAIYAMTYGNFGVLWNGCPFPYPGLRAVDTSGHFKNFPPRFVCLYRTKDGRVVERRD